MKLSKPNIPREVDADVAMSVVIQHVKSLANEDVSFTYDFNGVSERTALGDELNISIKNRHKSASEVKFSLKRDSLYHILPEYLFHSLDHYLNTDGDTDEFDKRYKEQEEQKNKALTYFKPFDQQYQQLRTEYQQWLNNEIFNGNQFLADFITDGYNINLNNPYIKAVYPCIPWLKDYRGNDELIRTSIQYAFKGYAEVQKERVDKKVLQSIEISSELQGKLNELYCGSTFNVKVWIWKVFYQTEIKTASELTTFKQQIKEFSDFFSTWFLPIEAELEMTFGDRKALPHLTESREKEGVFLNYSTQLI